MLSNTLRIVNINLMALREILNDSIFRWRNIFSTYAAFARINFDNESELRAIIIIERDFFRGGGGGGVYSSSH